MEAFCVEMVFEAVKVVEVIRMKVKRTGWSSDLKHVKKNIRKVKIKDILRGDLVKESENEQVVEWMAK